jgi:hypothetical protein
MQCLVLSARRYDFESNGRHVQGVTLTYLTPDSEEDQDGATRGLQPFKISGPLELFEGVHSVPGFYDLEMKQRPDMKGQPILRCTGARFLRPFSMAEAFSGV